MKANEKERLEKIEFSIRMLHFHNYINDTQFMKMMDKLNKEIKSIKEDQSTYNQISKCSNANENAI